MRGWAALVALAGLAMGCGGPPSRPSRPASDTERLYPALSFVPADVTWAVTARRAGDLALAIRALAGPLLTLRGESLDDVDRALAGVLGGSPLRVSELEEAGLDPRGGAALFGQAGGLPTIVLAVADAARLAHALDARRPTTGVSSTLHRGREVYSFQPDDGPAVAWVALDGWLAVHLGSPPGDRRWLEQILDAPSGAALAQAADFAAALARARARVERPRELIGAPPAAIALVRAAALARELGAAGGGCVAALAGAVRGLSASGDLGEGGGDFAIEVELAPAAAAALGRAVGAAPLPGLLAFRARAGLYASLAVELGWIDRALVGAGCGEGLGLPDPLRALGSREAGRGYHVAAEDLDLDDWSGHLMAQLELRSAGLFQQMLDGVPGRRFLERTERIAGLEVRTLDGLPGLPALAYRLTDRALLATVGRGMMRSLLAGRPSSSAARELFAVGLTPARAGKVADNLAAVARLSGGSIDRDLADGIAAMLARYESIGLRLVLDGDRLVLGGAMRLAR